MGISFKEAINVVTEDDFKTFVGVNAYKFEDARKRALAGKKTSFTWWGFLPVPYGLYYKFWVPFWFFTAALFVGDFLTMDEPTSGGKSLAAMVLLYYMATIKVSYVKHAYKKIAQAKNYEKDPERFKTLCERMGGTSKLALIPFFAILIFYTMIPIIFADARAERKHNLELKAQASGTLIPSGQTE